MTDPFHKWLTTSSLPARAFWNDDDSWLAPQTQSNVAISEDEKNVYVDAALPGIDPKNIDITFEKGVVWIKGEAEEKEEDKKKKYYRHATKSFSYRVAIPGEIDTASEPSATYKNGVMTVTFTKSPKTQPKKIQVKAA